MTLPTASVQIRRINYSDDAQPLTAVNYDDVSDTSNADVLDTVMKYNPYWSITGYHWDWGWSYQVAD